MDKHETDKQLSLSLSWEPIYIGDYRDNQLHGHGTLTWPDGDKYVGQVRDSQQHGQGIHTCPDGEKLVGEFKDGEFVGEK